MGKRLAGMLAFDIFGSLFMGISIVCFAVQANFAPGGVNGLAVLSNYLFSVPIGLATVLINIPIILLTFRKLGKEFFFISVKTLQGILIIHKGNNNIALIGKILFSDNNQISIIDSGFNH